MASTSSYAIVNLLKPSEKTENTVSETATPSTKALHLAEKLAGMHFKQFLTFESIF